MKKFLFIIGAIVLAAIAFYGWMLKVVYEDPVEQ